MDRLLDHTYRAEQRHFWFRGFRRFVRPILEEVTAGLEHPTLLDCGCGTGANLAMLSRYGRATGLDLTWRGLEYARRYGRRRLVQGSVVVLPFASRQFDVVTSFDVLYCLEEDAERRAVAEMFRVLRPGGAAIVNVAALEILRGNHSVLGQEVRRYTATRLRAVLERSGFEVRRLTYTNASLFPLMLGVRLLQRTVGLASPEEAGREIAVPSAPVNAALAGLLTLEAAALRRFDMPIGSSLLCMARRPI